MTTPPGAPPTGAPAAPCICCPGGAGWKGIPGRLGAVGFAGLLTAGGGVGRLTCWLGIPASIEFDGSKDEATMENPKHNNKSSTNRGNKQHDDDDQGNKSDDNSDDCDKHTDLGIDLCKPDDRNLEEVLIATLSWHACQCGR